MKKTLIAVSILSLLFVPMFAFAQEGTSGGLGGEFLSESGLTATKDIRTSAISLINVILSILGVIALVIILYGGFTWMTASGNEEKVTKARQIITAGIIGMIIVIAAYAIARFVIDQLYTTLGA